MKKIIKQISLSWIIYFIISHYFMMPVHAAATVYNDDVAAYFNSCVGNSWEDGMCLSFVSTCFRNLGGVYSSSCCAYNYGTSHIQSTDISSIPVGADVYFGHCGGGPCKTCGSSYYGHVGVYVGNGYFVHATGGIVQKSTLVNNWRSNFRGWGYHGGITIINPLPYPPVNLGDSFYAYIRHQNKQVYLTEESNSIYGRSFKGTTDQIWGFYRQPNGAYAIVNSGNNGCIDVLASSTEGGATVYTYTGGYEGLPNQEFYIFYEYGAYYFSPVHSNGNNMLDMSETTFKVELWGQGRDWSPQEFDIYIIPTVNGQYPANVGTDIYAYIRH